MRYGSLSSKKFLANGFANCEDLKPALIRRNTPSPNSSRKANKPD